MKRLTMLPLLFVVVAMFASSTPGTNFSAGPKRGEKWRALHLLEYASDSDLDTLGQSMPKLAQMGVNVLILEVDYDFEFKSHPELRRGTSPITKVGARKFAQTCRRNGIRLIPEFQSLGHQSWKGKTFPLLTVYPKFDLTPGAFPNNEGGLYCREWNPLDPDLNGIVFALIDEIIDAFQADALHAGMDEVFLLGSDASPATKGKDPAKLFAKAVNDLHDHLKKRHVEMLIWGDRLFDGKSYDFGEWESSLNGTAAAVDLIPKDIIICPWHYEKKEAYPSIPMFLKKGFRVLPAGWNNVEATQALIEYGQNQNSAQMLGHIFTTWGVKKDKLVENLPLAEGLKILTSKRHRQ